MANTLAPLSETAIANMAATTLDDLHLNSLDEDTPLGRFMASEFGFARDELLASHVWACAKTRKSLPKLAAAPGFGYDYQYQLPNDCLRIIPPRVDGCPSGTLIPYTREGRLILTNYEAPLPLVYIKRIVNPVEMDPLFARALGQYLAVMASQRITGKESYFTKANGLFERAITTAQQVNSLEIGDAGNNAVYNRDDVHGARLNGGY
jgi:hypothetical protein